jgi:hypothetical protein
MVRGYDLWQRGHQKLQAFLCQPTLCATLDARGQLALVQVFLCHLTRGEDWNFYVQPSDFTPIFNLKNHGNCPTSNTFLTAERTKTFCTTSLHRDWCPRCRRQLLLHLFAARRQLWLFADSAAIDVANDPTLSTYQHGHVIEKLERINTFPLRIGIRKMLTNVAKASST